MSEIDVQAKKNVQTKIDASYKKSKIKEHNIRSAIKNERKNKPDKSIFGVEYKAHTKKSKSLGEELHKEKKHQKFLDKRENLLEKNKGYGFEKDKLKYMGVYRDKKGGQVLDASKREWTQTKKEKFNTAWAKRQKKQGGGIAQRGLGRAFMKGGKV
jgi:hypothetical protein